jgi:hypothetical protein
VNGQGEFSFDGAPSPPASRHDQPRPTIQQRFEAFDAAFPGVFVLFRRFARELRAIGRKRYSADAILHRIRWEFAINPDRAFDDRKINNDFSSRYARKLADEEPAFEEFFEFRVLKTP